MRIATWDLPFTRQLVSALDPHGLGTSIQIEVGLPHECATWLKAGTVDVALVPTLSVIQDSESFPVIPGVCLASGPVFSYARLLLHTSLDTVKTLRVDPRYAQEIVLTRLLLTEHYGRSAEFVAQANPASEPPAHDGVLLVGSAATTAPEEALNLGLEWYELTTFPMVWGVFAGLVSADHALALREALLDAAHYPSLQTDDLQVILNDEAEAGLDALVHYLFMRGFTGDMPSIPYIPLPGPNPSSFGDEPEGTYL